MSGHAYRPRGFRRRGPYAIRIIGAAGPNPARSPHDGRWVVSCDVDAYEGLGAIVTSADPEDALRFPEPAIAWRYWMRESTVAPKRWDGEPNRPLTAYTVLIEPARSAGEPSASPPGGEAMTRRAGE